MIMDRRSFMKRVLAAAMVPLVIPKEPKRGALTVADIEKVRECMERGRIQPINGKYIMYMHPKQHYDLKVVFAKDKYRHEMHVKRWEAWSGKEYVEIEGCFT